VPPRAGNFQKRSNAGAFSLCTTENYRALGNVGTIVPGKQKPGKGQGKSTGSQAKCGIKDACQGDNARVAGSVSLGRIASRASSTD
jgi:hypothetical protein